MWVEAGISKDLTFLELVLIVVSAVIWRRDFQNRTMHIWCDNQEVIHTPTPHPLQGGNIR